MRNSAIDPLISFVDKSLMSRFIKLMKLRFASHRARSAMAMLSAAVMIDVPLVDLPFNAVHGGWNFPSMRQSQALSTGLYQSVHHAIGKEAEPTLGRRFGIAAFDFAMTWVPGGNSWMHEEWHRAVLTSRGIGSYDDVNDFPFGRSVIAVSHVADEELVRLKRDHPADQVRLSSAGIESQYEQNLLIEKRRFNEESVTWDRFLLWLNHTNAIFYLWTCASGDDADKSTHDQNSHDGANIPKRDFTGLDCTAWVYDLFRPDEPYAARGTHPSGVGINRYRSYSSLTEEEKDFLKLQKSLSLLNLADPFLFAIDALDLPIFGEGVRWNLTLRHHLTSFGYSIQGNLFYRRGSASWLLQLHNHFNAVRYFPGASAELSRYRLSGLPLSVSGRLVLWMQPEDQRVKSTVSVPGALATLTLHKPWTESFESYLGLEGKTPGWVAGNVYLERNLSLFLGLAFNY